MHKTLHETSKIRFNALVYLLSTLPFLLLPFIIQYLLRKWINTKQKRPSPINTYDLAGQGIRIHFMRIRIQNQQSPRTLFRIRVQLNKIIKVFLKKITQKWGKRVHVEIYSKKQLTNLQLSAISDTSSVLSKNSPSWVRIRIYCSGSGSSKNERADK